MVESWEDGWLSYGGWKGSALEYCSATLRIVLEGKGRRGLVIR